MPILLLALVVASPQLAGITAAADAFDRVAGQWRIAHVQVTRIKD